MYTMHITYKLENDKEYKVSNILKYDAFTIDDIIIKDIFPKNRIKIRYNKSVIPQYNKRPSVSREPIIIDGRSILFTYETKRGFDIFSR